MESGQSSSQVTAAALQARLTSHTTSLIIRLRNILTTLLPPAQTTNPITGERFVPPPSHTQTATETFQLSVETTALIRSCEELMGLSRAMKEIWLSGGLDTLEKADGDEGQEDDETRKKIKEDQAAVMRGVIKALTGKDVDEDGVKMELDGQEAIAGTGGS